MFRATMLYHAKVVRSISDVTNVEGCVKGEEKSRQSEQLLTLLILKTGVRQKIA